MRRTFRCTHVLQLSFVVCYNMVLYSCIIALSFVEHPINLWLNSSIHTIRTTATKSRPVLSPNQGRFPKRQ